MLNEFINHSLSNGYIKSGVYCGYSNESIIEFLQGTYSGKSEEYKDIFKKSVFAGTGFIPSLKELSIDPNIVINEINSRRFADDKFPSNKERIKLRFNTADEAILFESRFSNVNILFDTIVNKNGILYQTWIGICNHFGLNRSSIIFENVIKRYAEYHRTYHGLVHLCECFQSLRDNDCDRFHEIALAILFHDAIYDVRRTDNEQQSAELAKQELSSIGMHPVVINRIEKMILLTKHDREPDSQDEMLMLDVDLAIFGSGTQRLIEYNRQIRVEYKHVPNQIYFNKRREVLQNFLNKDRIYHTQEFYYQFEKAARADINFLIKLVS